MSKESEFYDKLKESLETSTKFPAAYLFKFIVPTTQNQLNEVKAVFQEKEAVLKTKTSKTNKYISVSVTMRVKNADVVIEKYKAVAYIEGIISL